MGTVDDREEWSVRNSLPDNTITVAIALGAIPLLVYVILGFFFDLSFMVFLIISFPMIVLCFGGLAVIAWNTTFYNDYAFISHRDYPMEVRPVETAIGLLLTSREARFDKEIGNWRLGTRMQVLYLCHDMDDVTMIVQVRPITNAVDGEWTKVRLLHDIEDVDKRRELEEAIDNAIAKPFHLGLKKYHLDEEPDLHVFET
jgi:hypothetical protein